MTAVAEGGETSFKQSEVEIYNACNNTMIGEFNPSFTRYIPESGLDEEILVAYSDEYVLSEVLECVQTFAYTMDDGSANPTELTLDADHGVLILETDSTRKREYTISITIT